MFDVTENPVDRVNDRLKEMGLSVFEAVSTKTVIDNLVMMNKRECDNGLGQVHNRLAENLPVLEVTITRNGLYPVFLEDIKREMFLVSGRNALINVASVEAFTRCLMQ